MSLRQVQGLDNGLHEEPKSPSSPGKLISDEYELPLESLLYLKKKKILICLLVWEKYALSLEQHRLFLAL